MLQSKGPQSRQVQVLDGEGTRHKEVEFPSPTITDARFQLEQEVHITDQLEFPSPSRVNTDPLECFVPPAMQDAARELNESRVTRDLRGQSVTRVIHNPATRVLSGPLTGTLLPAGAGRAAVVIPGKRKKGRKQEVQTRRMHPRLRYGLIVGAMMGIIGLALVTLTPLKSDQAQLPVFNSVVRWIETQQIAWTVKSHVSDQPQIATTDQPTTGTGNTAQPPITILPMSQYVAIARQAALTAGISPVYFVNQINAESSFNPYAVSPVGAVGIAQFMPSTAAGLGINPYDPIQALNGAAQHMAALTRSYGGNYAKALAAYNAGSGTVDYAVRQGGANWMNFVPYETKQYIYKIMGI